MSQRLVNFFDTVIAQTSTSFKAVAIEEDNIQVSFNDQYFLPEGKEICLAAENEILIETQNGWRKFYAPKGTVIQGPCVYAGIKHTPIDKVDQRGIKRNRDIRNFTFVFLALALISLWFGALSTAAFSAVIAILLGLVSIVFRDSLMNTEKLHTVELLHAERFLPKEEIQF